MIDELALKRYFVDPLESDEVGVGQRYKSSDIWIDGKRYLFVKCAGSIGGDETPVLVVRTYPKGSRQDILGFLNRTPPEMTRLCFQELGCLDISQIDVDSYSIEERRSILRAVVENTD